MNWFPCSTPRSKSRSTTSTSERLSTWRPSVAVPHWATISRSGSEARRRASPPGRAGDRPPIRVVFAAFSSSLNLPRLPAMASSMTKQHPAPVARLSYLRSPPNDRMKARERNSPSPVASAPFCNGWNSFSAEGMPGPVSQNLIDAIPCPAVTETSILFTSAPSLPAGCFLQD